MSGGKVSTGFFLIQSGFGRFAGLALGFTQGVQWVLDSEVANIAKLARTSNFMVLEVFGGF